MSEIEAIVAKAVAEAVAKAAEEIPEAFDDDSEISVDISIETSDSQKDEKPEHKLKRVFICSPFSPEGETESEMAEEMKKNIEKAQLACRYAVMHDCIPYAPHLYFTQFLNDGEKAEREHGRALGLSWLRRCDELWAVGRHISPGMFTEINKAMEWGIPVKVYVMKRTPEQRMLDEIRCPHVKINEISFEVLKENDHERKE